MPKIKNSQLFGKGCRGFQHVPDDVIDFFISMKKRGACFNKKLKKKLEKIEKKKQ